MASKASTTYVYDEVRRIVDSRDWLRNNSPVVADLIALQHGDLGDDAKQTATHVAQEADPLEFALPAEFAAHVPPDILEAIVEPNQALPLERMPDAIDAAIYLLEPTAIRKVLARWFRSCLEPSTSAEAADASRRLLRKMERVAVFVGTTEDAPLRWKTVFYNWLDLSVGMSDDGDAFPDLWRTYIKPYISAENVECLLFTGCALRYRLLLPLLRIPDVRHDVLELVREGMTIDAIPKNMRIESRRRRDLFVILGEEDLVLRWMPMFSPVEALQTALGLGFASVMRHAWNLCASKVNSTNTGPWITNPAERERSRRNYEAAGLAAHVLSALFSANEAFRNQDELTSHSHNGNTLAPDRINEFYDHVQSRIPDAAMAKQMWSMIVDVMLCKDIRDVRADHWAVVEYNSALSHYLERNVIAHSGGQGRLLGQLEKWTASTIHAITEAIRRCGAPPSTSIDVWLATKVVSFVASQSTKSIRVSDAVLEMIKAVTINNNNNMDANWKWSLAIVATKLKNGHLLSIAAGMPDNI